MQYESTSGLGLGVGDVFARFVTRVVHQDDHWVFLGHYGMATCSHLLLYSFWNYSQAMYWIQYFI